MMEHKAFLFDHDSFQQELQAILEDALVSGNSGALISFIGANLGELRDPYEGEPLGPDWKSLIETQDAHSYGDFALTKYYDPLADIGLGTGWERVQEVIANDQTSKESPVLGSTIGTKDDPFDPGKMGSYFQSARQVRHNCSYLSEIAKNNPSHDLDKAVRMLEQAMKAQAGLYVTF